MSSHQDNVEDRPRAAAKTLVSTLPLTLLLVIALVASAALVRMSTSAATPRLGQAIAPRQHTLPAEPQPFPGRAYDALQVVSVTAPSMHSATARLTLWTRAAVDKPWHEIGRPVSVDLGVGGLTADPREGKPATPLGSFTLTHAFGRAANAGHSISLSYRQLRPGDGWSSKPGPGYNALNRNGELYRGRNSWMRAAVLIDYNTHDPKQGAGSGFFLHVGDGQPTDGCIGLPLQPMLDLVGWLRPADHPRLLTGVVDR